MIRPISIAAVANGFVVTVGCQSLVFTSAGELCGELLQYLTDPDRTEERYLHTASNIKHTNNLPAQPTRCTHHIPSTTALSGRGGNWNTVNGAP